MNSLNSSFGNHLRLTDELISTLNQAAEPKITRRPKGRPANALPCNNPNIDFKDVRKRARRYVGNKAFYGATMERAINNAHRLVNSNHTKATHSALGFSHRTRLGIERDIAGWIVLFSTVNLTAISDRNWFKCFVNLDRLDEIVAYFSISRGSRFLDLYRKTDFLRVRYRQSNRNKDQKYCEIFISRKAFEIIGVSKQDLDSEIDRKERNDKKRLNIPNTMEYERARALAKRTQRHLYAVEKDHRKRKAQQNAQRALEAQTKKRKEDLLREALGLLSQLSQSYPNKSAKELKSLLIRKYPIYEHVLGASPPSKG